MQAIREEANGQAQAADSNGRFGDHFSFYDYYSDHVVRSMQGLVDYQGKSGQRALNAANQL